MFAYNLPEQNRLVYFLWKTYSLPVWYILGLPHWNVLWSHILHSIYYGFAGSLQNCRTGFTRTLNAWMCTLLSIPTFRLLTGHMPSMQLLSEPQYSHRCRDLRSLGTVSTWRWLARIGIPIIVMIGQSHDHVDGLVQERRNSNVLAMELCLPCNNPSILSL